MEKLRPNDQRARYAIAMIWVILFLNTAILILDLIGLMIYEGFIPVEAMSDFLVWLYLTGHWYASILVLIAAIVSIVAFIMWFRRAYYNLGLRYKDRLYGDAWTLWAWFIPFINWYMPFQIMKDLYKQTEKYMTFCMNEPYKGNLKTNYVNLWWVLWIISIVSTRVTLNINDPDQINYYFSTIGAIIQIALCVVTIIVIKDYSDAEKVLMEEQPEEVI
ncbi:MAG: DUF4328 domain-containing protein [Prevotella sp.]|jgi:hypothetical protein|nr:DUF4328 domain-containing protein [Prevotella sp.]